MSKYSRLSRRDLTDSQRERLDTALLEARRMHGVAKDLQLPNAVYRRIMDSYFDEFIKERYDAENAARRDIPEYTGKTFVWSPGGHKHRFPPGFED